MPRVARRRSIAIEFVALFVAGCASGAPAITAPSVRPSAVPATAPAQTVSSSRATSPASSPGAGACTLFTDDEILKSTGAPSIVSKEPISGFGVTEFEVACKVTLKPSEPHYTWDLTFGYTTPGGRTRFQQESALYDPANKIPGIGDDARWRTFKTDIIAVKGDTFAGVLYIMIPDFASKRPTTEVARELAKMLLDRL